jgi:transcriptional antiterminator RfaH
MTQRWYVIRTKPQSEYIAAAALEGDGHELFFPRVQTPQPRAGREDSPLFPGYLFLRYDLERQDRSAISDLPGVTGWVRFNGVTPPMPDEVIADLALRVEAINRRGGLWKQFRPGDTVRVVSGKLESLAQVLEGPKSPQSRARVLLDFMGRLVEAQVPWSSLQPTSESQVDNSRRPRRTRGKGRWIQGFGPALGARG